MTRILELMTKEGYCPGAMAVVKNSEVFKLFQTSQPRTQQPILAGMNIPRVFRAEKICPKSY